MIICLVRVEGVFPVCLFVFPGGTYVPVFVAGIPAGAPAGAPVGGAPAVCHGGNANLVIAVAFLL